ncbi:MAG: hypothetical protein ACXWX3_07625 [Actinomycetota bacterium]
MDAKKLEAVEAFLFEFLPRMKREPGIVEIAHYVQNDVGKATTLVIWESEDHVRKYREGDLIKEAVAFEKSQQLSSTRDGPFAVTRLA